MIRSWYQMAMLAAEAQQVIALRLMKLAIGGPGAQAEARRMVNEKVRASMTATGKLMTGASPDTIVQDYRRVVRANKRRLAK